MKCIILAVLVCACTASNAAYANAGQDGRYDSKTMSYRDFSRYDFLINEGYNLFLENCRKCHSRKNAKWAGFLHAESKTPEAWCRIFFKQYPKCAKKGSWENIGPQELLKINDYLYKYGANTYDPNEAEN